MFAKIFRTKILYIVYFIVILFILEFFQIRFEPVNIFSALNSALPVLIAILTFALVIALFRLEGFRIVGKTDKADSVRNDLSKFGTRVIWATFIFLIILFLAVSNKTKLLNWEFKLHIDTIIMSLMTVLVIYVIGGAISYIKEENLKAE
jgi:hypothetical protein